MTATIIRLPANDFLDAAKRALHFAGQRVLTFMNSIANRGARDLAGLDRRALIDAGYDQIDWESESGEAIQRALVKIYDW
ncbi:MAG: hypothetical protein ABJI96_00700 [Paracoccaceae bacterium]